MVKSTSKPRSKSTNSRKGVKSPRSSSTDTTIAKSPKTALKQRRTPESWNAIARMVVMENMTFQEAGVKAGLSKSYVSSVAYKTIAQDMRYNKLVEGYRHKLSNESTLSVREIQNNAKTLYNACFNGDVPIPDMIQAALKANEQLGRTIAAFVDKSITQTEDVKPMTPAERAIMSKLAKVYLEAKFNGAEGLALVDNILDAEPIDIEVDPESYVSKSTPTPREAPGLGER